MSPAQRKNHLLYHHLTSDNWLSHFKMYFTLYLNSLIRVVEPLALTYKNTICGKNLVIFSVLMKVLSHMPF